MAVIANSDTNLLLRSEHTAPNSEIKIGLSVTSLSDETPLSSAPQPTFAEFAYGKANTLGTTLAKRNAVQRVITGSSAAYKRCRTQALKVSDRRYALVSKKIYNDNNTRRLGNVDHDYKIEIPGVGKTLADSPQDQNIEIDCAKNEGKNILIGRFPQDLLAFKETIQKLQEEESDLDRYHNYGSKRIAAAFINDDDPEAEGIISSFIGSIGKACNRAGHRINTLADEDWHLYRSHFAIFSRRSGLINLRRWNHPYCNQCSMKRRNLKYSQVTTQWSSSVLLIILS